MKWNYSTTLICTCFILLACKGDLESVAVNTSSIQIVYEAQLDIYTVSSEGTNLKRLTLGLGGSHPRWSPDGKWIAYYCVNSEHRMTLYMMNRDGTMNELITNVSEPYQVSPIMFEWSPTGEYIAYITPDYRLAVLDMNTRQTQMITEGNVAALPHWSPDGTKILFSYAESGVPDAHIVNRDGSGMRALASQFHHSFASDWSKDSNKILVGCSSDSTIPSPINLFSMYPDGSELKQLTFDGRTSGGAYSPDGSTIFFLDSSRTLCTMKTDGSSKNAIIYLGDYFYKKIKNSSDGTTIFYLRLVPNALGLYSLCKSNSRGENFIVLKDSVGSDFDIFAE